MKASITFVPPDMFRCGRNLARQPISAIYLLGNILINEQIPTRIVDPYLLQKMNFDSFEEMEEQIICDSDILFFSSNTYNWYNTSRVIRTIKEYRPELPIVLGGVHPTMMDMHIMNTTKTDAIIRGEGEKAIISLAKALVNHELLLEHIDGITFRDVNGNIKRNKDAIALSAEEFAAYNSVCCFEQLPEDVYFGIPCETSRGCKFHCAFCGITHHGTWKSLSMEQMKTKLRQSIDCMNRKTPNGIITITDDCFTTDQERLVEILRYLPSITQGCSFVMEGRLNEIVSKPVMEALKKNRIQRFLVGIECGYDEGLRKMRKGYTTAMIEDYLYRIKEAGLSHIIYCSFIIFLPWESEEECLKTVHFAARLVERFGVQSNISIWNIIPSELWENREEYGLQLEETLFDENFMSDYVSYENFMLQIHPKITKESYRKITKVIAMYESRAICLTNN